MNTRAGLLDTVECPLSTFLVQNPRWPKRICHSSVTPVSRCSVPCDSITDSAEQSQNLVMENCCSIKLFMPVNQFKPLVITDFGVVKPGLSEYLSTFVWLLLMIFLF